MGHNRKCFVARASVIAVRGALAALAVIPGAYAADSEQAVALTRPTNSVEVGIGAVDKDSYKFGEYNGLEQKGAYLHGGFSLRGGGGYDSAGTTRWSVNAADLGLNTRSLGAEFGEQGRFRINFGYDEIQRNQYDDYKTPYRGGGTTTLTLPGYPTTRTGTTGLANWNNYQSPYATGTTTATYAGRGPGVLLPAMMSEFKVDTLRTRASFEVSTVLSPAWQFKFSARHEDKEGTKLTGVAPGGGLRQGLLAPEPINNDTNQFKANLTFVDARGNLDFGYYGSFFQNKIKSWSLANPFASTTNDPVFGDTARLVGAPSNEMHRWNLTGAYNFSRTTRLVVSGYYQRMTQNEGFQGPFPAGWVMPDSSAHGLVVNKHLNATLTMRPVRNLALTAAYKYEDRDDRTPPRTYTTTWNDSAAAAQFNTWSMDPLKRKSHQLTLEGDYQFAPRQAIKAGYEWQEVERDANSSAVQAHIDRYRAAFLAAGLDAVAHPAWKAEKTKENTLKLEYRNNLSEVVTGRVGYSYSQRRTHYEDNESLTVSPINPPRIAPDGYFPAADPFLPGFRQYYLADRNRDRLRGAINFRATEALALQTGLSYNKDDYSNSPYGLKNDRSWVFNLDGTYAASDNLSFNAFYTYEDKQSRLESLAISRATNSNSLIAVHTPGNCTGYTTLTPAPIAPATSILPADHWYDPCRNWSETQNDRIDTLGLGFKAAGLMGGKLDFAGDLAYSRSRTPISFTGGSYAGNGLTAAGSVNNVWVATQSFPDITSELIMLRLSGRYTIDKSNAVRVTYQYNHLKSSDWQWDRYQSTPNAPNLSYAVTMPGMLGTGISSPNYTVNSIMVAYIYSFR